MLASKKIQLGIKKNTTYYDTVDCWQTLRHSDCFFPLILGNCGRKVKFILKKETANVKRGSKSANSNAVQLQIVEEAGETCSMWG